MSRLWLPVLLIALACVACAGCSMLGQTRSTATSRSRNNRGAALMTQHNFEAALAEFRAASRPVNEGLALSQLGRVDEAEAVFRRVLATNPSDPRAHYNLGLVYRSEGKLAEAAAEFAAVLAVDPTDAFTNYFLGTVRFQQQDYAGAATSYLRTIELDPAFASAYFGASRAYTALQETDRAAVYQERFQALTQGSGLNAAVGNQYGEQGPYALAEEMDSLADGPATNIAVRFSDVSAGEGLAGGGIVCLIDFNKDGLPDLFLGNRLFRNQGRRRPQFVAAQHLQQATACSVGDYDNDGYADLLLITSAGAVLYHNNAGTLAAVPSTITGTSQVAFVDLDHDGWLDVVSGSRAFRNKADGTFSEQPMPGPPGAAAAIVPTDYDNDRDIDVLIADPAGAAYFESNNRDGTFSRAPLPDQTQAASSLSVLDYDKDGWMDLLLTPQNRPPVLLRNVNGKTFNPVPLPLPPDLSARQSAVVDFDNDGFLDLVFIARRNGRDELRLVRNLGSGKFEDVSARSQLERVNLRDAQSILAVDLDDDGDTDLVVVQKEAPPLVLRNEGGNRNNSLKLSLTGLKDNRLAIGTKVELRGESLRQKLEVAIPGDLLIGTGKSRADFVRMLWPTGVVQDEIPGNRSRVSYEEIDRKGSSCPTLYSWDGSKFRFINDVIGPGVIGEWESPGKWNDSDTDEYIRLTDADIQPQDDVYRFRVLSQMQEVTYLDALKLVAIDTPAGVDVYNNDRYQPLKPYPEFKLWQVSRARAPVSVKDDAGNDVSKQVAEIDGIYAPVSRLQAFPGFAQPHSLIVDVGELPPSGKAQLILRGYTEYFDSTTAHSAYSSGIEPVVPDLEVADGKGGWIRKSESIGLPAGLPKDIVVDLTGIFPSSDHRIRTTNNMEIYWDRILVNTFEGGAPMTVTTIVPKRAELRSAGYPLELRKRPETYDYSRRSATDAFEFHAGNYTRYGDVVPLMTEVDDMYAIMASGDEIAAEFDVRSLPVLAPGWHRTFLVFADGFEKARETYTPYPDTVGPLPFHGMSRFPYPAGEHYPDDLRHLRYQLEYNTRHIAMEPPATAAYRRR